MGGKKKARLRVRVGYEPNVPTCSICKHFQPHVNSMPPVPAYCGKHNFTVKPRGCCDYWICRFTGVPLEGAGE